MSAGRNWIGLTAVLAEVKNYLRFGVYGGSMSIEYIPKPYLSDNGIWRVNMVVRERYPGGVRDEIKYVDGEFETKEEAINFIKNKYKSSKMKNET